MFAFTPSVPVAATKPTIGHTSFSTPLASRPASRSGAPTMVMRTTIRPLKTGAISVFGGAAGILAKADEYMAQCVRSQYLQAANPTGEFSVMCTEGSVQGAAEAQRVRVLSTRYRDNQASKLLQYARMYENRLTAIQSSHSCNHEEGQFSDYRKVASTYNTSKSEALGVCMHSATPETVEEAAMMRYMDIAQNNAANPSGVYNLSCNEGSCKGAAEDLRVASLNMAFRNGQKPTYQILQDKYNQKKKGYAACHSCNYEEGLISLYPAIGATFRPKTYGY